MFDKYEEYLSSVGHRFFDNVKEYRFGFKNDFNVTITENSDKKSEWKFYVVVSNRHQNRLESGDRWVKTEKEVNDILKKVKDLPKFSDEIILWSIRENEDQILRCYNSIEQTIKSFELDSTSSFGSQKKGTILPYTMLQTKITKLLKLKKSIKEYIDSEHLEDKIYE